MSGSQGHAEIILSDVEDSVRQMVTTELAAHGISFEIDESLASETWSEDNDDWDQGDWASDDSNLPTDIPDVGSNVISYSSFENSGKGWSAGGGWTAWYQWAPAFDGLRVARCVTTGWDSGDLVMDNLVKVDRRYPYWVSAWSYMYGYTKGSGQFFLREYDTNGVLLQEKVIASVTAIDTQFKRLTRRIVSSQEQGSELVWHKSTLYAQLGFRAVDAPTLEWYVDAVQLEQARLLGAYSPKVDEVAGSSNIPIGSLPPNLIDTTPPSVPQNLQVSSDTILQTDGTYMMSLRVSFTHPTESDYVGSYVQATRQYIQVDENNPTTATPLWDQPVVGFFPSDQSQVVLSSGIRAATRYWVRAYSVDRVNNKSAFSDVVEHFTLGDMEAPPIPDGLVAVPGFKIVGLQWNPVQVSDIAFYEVRNRRSGTSDDWVITQTRGSFMVVPDLDIGVAWDFQVRAVDTSFNVATSDSDPRPQNAKLDLEAGWSPVVTATPVAVGQGGSADIAANTIIANHIAASAVTANKLGAGVIEVNTTTDTSKPDGFRVLDGSGNVLSKWDENGMVIYDTAAPTTRYLLMTNAGIKLVTDGNPANAVVAITPDGIDASKITFGTSPGGHNLLKNSGFELNAFQTVNSTATWTDTSGTAPHWSTTYRVGSVDNMTEDGTGHRLKMSTKTF